MKQRPSDMPLAQWLDTIAGEFVALMFGLSDAYRRTSSDPDGDGVPGPNHWTFEAAVNAVMLRPYMERALALVKGRRTSVYRSPDVNKAVGGVVGSWHTRGRAQDLVPTDPAGIDQAARVLEDAADRGELGPLAHIILERGKTGRGGRTPRIHLDWKPDGPPPVLKVTEDKRF